MTRSIPTNEPAVPRDRPLRGIALLVTALVFFSCSDAASKLMTATLPTIQVAWLHFCVITLLMLGAVASTGRRDALRSRRLGLQAVRALAVTASSILFIMGLAFLPMAEATAIAFVSPLMVTALSIPILGEPMGRWFPSPTRP
jgi:drug/metabolite transporter (DMT)-like permease